MIYYDYYADVPAETVEAFVQEREMGRLVTVNPQGAPHIGLFPFAREGDTIILHLNRADEQIADLQSNAQCAFEVDEVLGTIPSYWVHPESGVMATAYHRAVVFDCAAMVYEDAAVLAAQQARLLARYQPEGGYKPVTPDDPLYRGAMGVIAAVQLKIQNRRVKFKLGQNRSLDVRAKIATELRKRGRPSDARAADALEWTIERERRR